MHVIVVGGGEVGSTTAANLADEHDVVVVDLDPDLVDAIQYEHDVLGVTGDGTDIDTLEEAGIAEADMVIASTDSDEANIVTCGTAKTVSDAFTIARVRKPSLLRTWEGAEGAFGVDFMVSVDLLTAERIVQIAALPGAEDVGTFADGVVRMAEFAVGEDSPVADRTVAEADRWDELTFAAVFRNGEVVVPRGDTVIRPGDDLLVIGTAKSCREFATSLGESVPGTDEDVVIVGGGTIGEQAAKLFERRGYTPRLIEQDPGRARELAEELPGTVVLNHDPTDVEFMRREHVGDADVVVAALDGDEANLLVSLLADRLGAARTVAIVETAGYVELFETVGVDAAVNPREVTAEEITRFTHNDHTENVAFVETGKAEVLEIQVDEASVLANRSLREAGPELPEGVVVGAITRGRDRTFVTPRGDTVVQVGDHVVVFIEEDLVGEVEPQL